MKITNDDLKLAALLNHSIDEMELSYRSYCALKRWGHCDTVGMLIENMTHRDIMTVRNVGVKTKIEIEDRVREFFADHGYEWSGVDELKNFYFVFGDDDGYPYGRDDYLVVRAEDIDKAATKFMAKYPSEEPDVVNCADYYPENIFMTFKEGFYPDKDPVEVIE